MNGRPGGRQGDLEARRAWTARLHRFAGARTAKQREAALDTALKINPGKTLRDMLHAWGYSASARGRKARGTQNDKAEKPARERLELTLGRLFGKKPTPIPSLNPKLAGSTDITVKDACRLVAALLASWPESIQALNAADTKESARKVVNMAESFVRDLLSELSAGRSLEWAAGDLEIRVFRLVDEERIGVSHFIKEAGEKEGALIVAGARRVLLGTDPIDIIQQFHSLTSHFIGQDHNGILIFVFDAAIFEAGRQGFNLLYNIGLLSTAMTAFALFPEDYDYRNPIQEHKVDWSRWRMLNTRCCVVMRKPPPIDPISGEILKRDKFDEFVASCNIDKNFAKLGDLRGFVRFDSEHVLPRKYPSELGNRDDLSDEDLYWDVLIRPSPNEREGLAVRYFIPPPAATKRQQESDNRTKSGALTPRAPGRPATKTISIEEDFFYVVRRDLRNAYYDDAQRAIYLAARGRLNLDSGERHSRNLNAAAALRQVGYEVLPVSTMLSMFPEVLHVSAAQKPDD